MTDALIAALEKATLDQAGKEITPAHSAPPAQEFIMPEPVIEQQSLGDQHGKKGVKARA